MRHVIVHYHIFKNAGSSIDGILKNNFGRLCGSIEGEKPWDTLPSGFVLNYVLNNPNIKTVSSHHARLPNPIHSRIFFHPLIFLRHPIDRVGSVYSFERRQPIGSPSLGAKIARENDLAGYVRWRLSNGNGAVIKNFHTVHLSGREIDMRIANATSSDLKEAVNRIDSLPFLGIVELFDESVTKMISYLAPYFGTIKADYTIANKSPDRKMMMQERLNEIEAALGSNLYQELLDNNALDLQLYDKAKGSFK